MCALAHPWEAILIGIIGGALSISTPSLLQKLGIDDPVGVIPVHGVCSLWGMLSVGLFVQEVGRNLCVVKSSFNLQGRIF